MGRFRAFAIGLALLAGGAWPIAGTPGIACAAGEGPRAVLVVDTGARVTRYCVALDGASVTGTRLIELASAQYGMPYSLGFGGQAVCMLHGVGPTGGDCWAEYPNYWGYWHGDGGSGWTWAGGSAASYLVRDGAVEGWVWGAGDTPSTHGKPPPTRSSDVCAVIPSPTPSPGGGGGFGGGSGGGNSGGGGSGSGGSGDGGSGASGSGAAAPGGASPSGDGSSTNEGNAAGKSDDEPQRDERERSDTPTATVTGSADGDPTDAGDERLRAAGSSIPAGGGPPLGMLLAIVLGVGLAVAGWWRVRTSGAGQAGEPR